MQNSNEMERSKRRADRSWLEVLADHPDLVIAIFFYTLLIVAVIAGCVSAAKSDSVQYRYIEITSDGEMYTYPDECVDGKELICKRMPNYGTIKLIDKED